uniref:PAX-interacting protein 1 n=1 Tax=Timema monikensis TaxID=170555 RepID=A0A7R9HL71_9NEOP|nr:unnamed protein product [Timema monikensis]
MSLANIPLPCFVAARGQAERSRTTYLWRIKEAGRPLAGISHREQRSTLGHDLSTNKPSSTVCVCFFVIQLPTIIIHPIRFTVVTRRTTLPVRFTAVTRRTALPVRFTAVTRQTTLPVRFIVVTRRTTLPIRFTMVTRRTTLPTWFTAIVLEPNVRYQLQSKTDLVFANVRATYIKTSDEESASCPFTLELTSGFEIPATPSPKTQNEAKLIDDSFDEDSSMILPSQDVKPQLIVFHIPSLQSFKSNKTSVVGKNTHPIKTQSGSKNIFQENLESNNTEETDQRNQPENGSKVPEMVCDEGKQTDSSFDDDDDDSIFNAPTQVTDNIFNELTQVTDNNTTSISNVKPGESSKTISARDWDDSLFDEATQIIEETGMVLCENLQDSILSENIPNSCNAVENKIKQGLSKNPSNLVTNNDSLDHSLLEGNEEMFTLTTIKEELQSVPGSEECHLKKLTCASPSDETSVSDTTLEISSTKKNNPDFENQPTLIYEPSSSGENKHSNIHKNDSDSEIFAAETQVFDSIDEAYAFNVKHASTPINHTVVDGKLLENIYPEDCEESRNRSKIILQNLHSSIIKESYISLVDLKYLKENVLPRKETVPNRASEAPTQILTTHKVQQLGELSPKTIESSTESIDALEVAPQLQSHFKPTTLIKSSEKETIICTSDKISSINKHDNKERDLKSELQVKIKFLNIPPNLITHKLNLPSTDNSDCLNEKPPIIDRSVTVANSSVDVDALKINHLKHNEIDKIEESKVMKLVTADTEPFHYSGSSWKTLRTYSRKYRSIDIDEDIDADIDERLLGTPEKPDSPSLILPTSQDIQEASLTVRRLVTPPDSDASDSEHYNPVNKTSFRSHKAVQKLSLDFEDSELSKKKPGSKYVPQKETSPYKTRNGDFQESRKKVELEFQVSRRNKLRTYPGHKNARKSSPPNEIDDANSIKPLTETKTLKPELGECSPNVQAYPSLGTSFKKQTKRKQVSKQKKQPSTTCSTRGKVNSKKSPKRIAQIVSETCSEQTLGETESRPSRSRKMTWKALDMASTNFATRTSSLDLAGRHLRSESSSRDSVYKHSEESLQNSTTSTTQSKKSESNDTKKSLSKIRSMKSLTESSKDNPIKPSMSTTTNINTKGSGGKRKIVNTNKIDDINVTTKRTRIEPRTNQRDNSSSNSKALGPFKGKETNNTPQKVKTSEEGLPNKANNNKSDRTEHILEADKTANKNKVTPKRQTTMNEFSFRSSSISAKSLVDRESSLSTQATTGIVAAVKGRSNTKSPHKLTPQLDHSITRSVNQMRKSKRCSVKSEDIDYQENKNLSLQNKSKKMVMESEHNNMSVIIDISSDDNDPAESNNIILVQKKVVRRKKLVESNTSNANKTTRQARSRGLKTEQTNNVKNESCEMKVKVKVKVKERVKEDDSPLQNSLSTSVARKKTLKTSKVSSTNPTSSSFKQNTQSSQSENNSENSVGWNQEGSWRGRVRKRTNIFEEAGSYASLAGRGKRYTTGAASSSEERLPTPPKQRKPFYGHTVHRSNSASSRSSNLCKTSPIYVLFTGLNEEQFKIQSEIVYRLGTESFILQDKESEKKFKFQLTETLLSSAESPLLAGYSVLVTPKVLPPPKEIKGIVESCGGSWLSRAPARWPVNSFIISCAADKDQLNKLKNCKRPIVSAEVLLSGVLQHKLDLITYKLQQN